MHVLFFIVFFLAAQAEGRMSMTRKTSEGRCGVDAIASIDYSLLTPEKMYIPQTSSKRQVDRKGHGDRGCE